MIQRKLAAITETTSDASYFKRRERMKRIFFFVSKISEFISKLSDIAWVIIIFILFITIFIYIFLGIIK